MARYGPPQGNAELRAYADIVARAFAGDQEAYVDWAENFSSNDSVRLLTERADVLAGLVFYRMGQHFGGRSVATWGVAGVGVKPELRGAGLATQVLRENLQEAHREGVPLATLYPAIPSLYQRLGWEFAGLRTRLRVPLEHIAPRATEVRVRAMRPEDEPLLADLYARRYRQVNGSLDRNPQIWRRVRKAPEETPVMGYIAHRGEEAVGYTHFLQKRDIPGEFRYNLHVRDFVYADIGAADALLGLFARHSSMARELHIFVAASDPLISRLLATPEFPQDLQMGWMLRVVSVPAALQSRGYNATVQATATLRVRDAELPGNDGAWTLRLEHGRMQVERGGSGGPEISIGALAALYSGFQSPDELRLEGRLQGDDSHDGALGAMFAGPAPWMPDHF